MTYTGVDGVQRGAEQHLWHLREEAMRNESIRSKLEQTIAHMEAIVSWNERVPLGSHVVHRTDDGAAIRATRTEAMLCGGTPMVWLEGILQGVPLALLTLPPQSDEP